MATKGKEQSPIALYRSPANNPNFKKMKFQDTSYKHSYQKNMDQVYEDVWTGTSYQVRLDYRKDFQTTGAASLLFLNPKLNNYDFTTRGVQFHFHSPSEHTIDGREFDLELHIVHKLMYTQKNQEEIFNNFRYAVTGVMFDVPKNLAALNESQKQNMEFFDTFMTAICEHEHPFNSQVKDGIDLEALMSRVDRQKRWIYRGSFTTPPLLEGVLWNVIDDIQYIKPETLKLFLERKPNHPRGDRRCNHCHGNNRSLAPLNDRTVYYIEEDNDGNDAEKNRCRH